MVLLKKKLLFLGVGVKLFLFAQVLSLGILAFLAPIDMGVVSVMLGSSGLALLLDIVGDVVERKRFSGEDSGGVFIEYFRHEMTALVGTAHAAACLFLMAVMTFARSTSNQAISLPLFVAFGVLAVLRMSKVSKWTKVPYMDALLSYVQQGIMIAFLIDLF